MKKKILVISLLAVAVLVLAGCTQQAPAPTATPVVTPAATEAVTEVPAATAEQAAAPQAALELTLEELAKFNGKYGQRALIAVDGIIYDVTDSRAWKDGMHNGFEAGKDLTEEIKTKSPHGIGKLEGITQVGKLKAE